MNESLIFYTIYDHPTDFPHSFVVRRWTVINGPEFVKVADLLPYAVGPTLDAVRAVLPEGLYNLGREKDDDPSIAETGM